MARVLATGAGGAGVRKGSGGPRSGGGRWMLVSGEAAVVPGQVQAGSAQNPLRSSSSASSESMSPGIDLGVDCGVTLAAGSCCALTVEDGAALAEEGWSSVIGQRLYRQFRHMWSWILARPHLSSCSLLSVSSLVKRTTFSQ